MNAIDAAATGIGFPAAAAPAPPSDQRLAKTARTGRPAIPPALREEVAALSVPDGRLHLLYGAPYIASYFACAAFVLASDDPLRLWLAGIAMGHQLYLLFILHHDCVHFAAFRERRWNVLLGRLYALFLVKTFTATYETHRRHHSALGLPGQDPDEYFFAAGLKWVLVRYWSNFTRHTGLALTRYGSEVRRAVIAEQCANVAFWAGVHGLLFALGMGEKALFLFWLPVATITLVVGPVTRAYEHLPMTLFRPGDPRRTDPACNTVTVTSRFLGILWAGVTYHAEHHAFARVPFYRLRRLHLLLRGHGVAYLTAPYTLFAVAEGERMIALMRGDR
jgi:fatty acid desaturase